MQWYLPSSWGLFFALRAKNNPQEKRYPRLA
jgi:hypothetical protein